MTANLSVNIKVQSLKAQPIIPQPVWYCVLSLQHHQHRAKGKIYIETERKVRRLNMLLNVAIDFLAQILCWTGVQQKKGAVRNHTYGSVILCLIPTQVTVALGGCTSWKWTPRDRLPIGKRWSIACSISASSHTLFCPLHWCHGSLQRMNQD